MLTRRIALPASKRRITIEDLFRLRTINQAAISPDGSRVALSIKRGDPRKNKNFASLYLVAAKGGRLRRLTTGHHVDTLPEWSPDGKALAFLSDRDKCSAIWLLPMEGGEPARLTDKDYDVSSYAFSRDGKHICYAAKAKSEREKLQRDEKKDQLESRPDYEHVTRLFYKCDGEGFWNGQYSHIWMIPVSGGKARRLTDGDYADASPQFSPDGKRIAFLSNRLPDPDREIENADIFTVPTKGGRIKQITRRRGPVLNYSWSPDGRQFAFVGHMGKSGEFFHHNMHVWVIPASGGAARNVTPETDNHCVNFTVADVPALTFTADPPMWSSDGRKIRFAVSEQGACNLYETEVRRRKSRPILVGDHVILGASKAAHTEQVALVIGTQTDPNEVFILDLGCDGAAPRQITR
jgi:Tol biopolymer transport system component